VIHNYRWRLALVEGESKYAALDKNLAELPMIAIPTTTLEGDANDAPHADAASYAKQFSGKDSHRLIKGGIGHNLLQEAPTAFAQAVIDVGRILMYRNAHRVPWQCLPATLRRFFDNPIHRQAS
jgi:pimeloyl-ACP methyl ester carboxylesterase